MFASLAYLLYLWFSLLEFSPSGRIWGSLIRCQGFCWRAQFTNTWDVTGETEKNNLENRGVESQWEKDKERRMESDKESGRKTAKKTRERERKGKRERKRGGRGELRREKGREENELEKQPGTSHHPVCSSFSYSGAELVVAGRLCHGASTSPRPPGGPSAGAPFQVAASLLPIETGPFPWWVMEITVIPKKFQINAKPSNTCVTWWNLTPRKDSKSLYDNFRFPLLFFPRGKLILCVKSF